MGKFIFIGYQKYFSKDKDYGLKLSLAAGLCNRIYTKETTYICRKIPAELAII